ncbi:MAG: YegS/Rv2252/BmrU family lipid kinase [Deinococcales bacterium]
MPDQEQEQEVHLIVNPTAGRGRAKREIAAVRDSLAKLTEFSFHETHYRGEAREIAAQLPDAALILSLGGDGTLNEIAHSCAHSKRKIGVLPAGSGDDFAKAIGISSLSEGLKLVEAFLQGGAKLQKVDSGVVRSEHETRRFVNTVGIGFDAEVGERMQRLPLFLKGQVAYLCALGIHLFVMRSVACEVRCDGESFFQGSSLFISNQNGPRTGGSFYLSPHAKVQDGLLDVVIAGRLGVLETLVLVPQTLSGKLINHEKIFRKQARQLEIKFAEARLGHTEGELLQPSRWFGVGLEPQSLNILMP